MPPVDLASGDKHTPVKLAAGRPPAIAPPLAIGLKVRPLAIGLKVRPSFWLVRATVETPTPPARATGTLTTPSNVTNSRRPVGSPLPNERILLHR